MTTIVSWNIQSGRAADGRLDLSATIAVLRRFGPADVMCLQEVARCDPHWDDGQGADQVEALRAAFPDHDCLFGAAYDRLLPGEARRRAFGNLVLARVPVLQVFAHPLSQHGPHGLETMPRQALEVVIEAEAAPLRIVTTHLEYSDPRPRTRQIERLRDILADCRPSGGQPSAVPSAAWPRPCETVVCGDFNMPPDSPEYRLLLSPGEDGAPSLVDAWRRLNGLQSHPPTAGVYDRSQWPHGPLSYDFFLVSQTLADRIEALTVDGETDASDHQPLLLKLAL